MNRVIHRCAASTYYAGHLELRWTTRSGQRRSNREYILVIDENLFSRTVELSSVDEIFDLFKKVGLRENTAAEDRQIEHKRRRTTSASSGAKMTSRRRLCARSG
jgi:hypothetical protein